MMGSVSNAPDNRRRPGTHSAMTRRGLLAGAGALLVAGGARARRATSLRVLKLRHSSFLVELGDARALVDPCFSRGLGFGALVDAPEAALPPGRVGRHEALLVTCGRPDLFSPRTLAALPGRDAYCLVPDDDVRKALRYLGYRRVRVVRGGDEVRVAGLDIAVAPSVDGLGARPAVAYRIARDGRSVFHAGAAPPLDLAGDLVRWARKRWAEVVVAPWDAWTLGGRRRLTMGSLDAQLLAALMRARAVVSSCDDARPSAVGGLLMSREPGAPQRELAEGPRVVVAEPGVWYRVAARRRRDGWRTRG